MHKHTVMPKHTGTECFSHLSEHISLSTRTINDSIFGVRWSHRSQTHGAILEIFKILDPKDQEKDMNAQPLLMLSATTELIFQGVPWRHSPYLTCCHFPCNHHEPSLSLDYKVHLTGLATWGGSPGHWNNLVSSTLCCHHRTCEVDEGDTALGVSRGTKQRFLPPERG